MRDDDIEIHKRGLLYGLGNDKLGLEIERYVDRNNLSQAVCKSQDSVRVGRKRSTKEVFRAEHCKQRVKMAMRRY